VTTFALVHGAWHGAWCWDPLVGELENRGQSAVAVELPSAEVSAGPDEYAQVVIDALREVDGPVDVVGHSLGGLTIPLVAAARPVRRLVFLCGFVPRPGRGPWELEDGEPSPFGPTFGGFERDELGRTVWRDIDRAIEQLYPDCDPGHARAAAARLRPQGPRPNSEPCPLDALPEVDYTMILAADDVAVSRGWAQWTARKRLGGIEPIELPGGHSPMLARPAALADALVAQAASTRFRKSSSTSR
jgi:pimeloyl-ACP methyl ester carboxylesterase